jgi:nitrile hydratase accessory protein
VRSDNSQVGDARRRVEQLLVDLPGDGGHLSFEQPWELRAFALAVAAHHNGYYDWSEFQLALIGSIHRWEGGGEAQGEWRYYERWLEALETVLSGTGVLNDAELDDLSHIVMTTPRDADHQHAKREPVAVDVAR